jgi:hypothetical protein
VEGFGEYRNPESASPVPLCTKCAHHRQATYPDGLCKKEYCQQDYPCHGFDEIGQTDNIAGLPKIPMQQKNVEKS